MAVREKLQRDECTEIIEFKMSLDPNVKTG